MKKGKKVLFKAAMFSFAAMFACTSYVSANDSVNISPRARAYFSGSANWYWSTISAPNLKVDNLSTAVVQWTYSSDQNPHRMHFKVVNGNGEFRGSEKFYYLQYRDFKTTALQGYNYYLATSREFIEQAVVTVAGYWEP